MGRILLLFLVIILISKSYSEENLFQYKIFTNVEEAGNILHKYLNETINAGVDIYVQQDFRIKEKGIYAFVCESRCFGFSVEDLSDQGFKIKKYSENIFILSKSKVGLTYGVYTFLENLGFKFLSQGYIYIPETISFKFVDIIENPRFIYREIFVKELDEPSFSQILKLNGRLGHREERSFRYGNTYILTISLNDIVPYERYGETDPEYFCGNQLDFTNDEVKEIARVNLDRILSRHKHLENLHVLISPNDINDYCRNEPSLKRISEGGSPSTPYLDFVKYMATTLEHDYPNVKFLALAYHWSRKPPENYSHLPKNMGIFFSTIDADFSKPLLIRNNTYILRDLEKWTEITDYIFVWHYIANFGNYLIPFPNIYQVADDIKYFSKIKEIKGVFLQGAYNTFGSDMVELKSWLFSKLLWNPKLNVDELLREFLTYYYGSAAREVEEYIDKLYKYVKDPKVILSIKTPSSYLNSNLIMDLYYLLEKAKQKERYLGEHIEKLIFGLYVAILLNQHKINDIEIIKKAKNEIRKFVDKFNISMYSESNSIEDLLNIKVSDKTPEKPEILQETSLDWIDFQEFSLKICCSDVIEDKYASNGLAVAVAGWKTDWAIQLDLKMLPKGTWDLYVVVRVQARDGLNPEGIVAFRYGIYPISEAMEAYLEDFYDGEYKIVHIGKYSNDSNLVLWIAPPGNENIEYLLVDRIFAVLSK